MTTNALVWRPTNAPAAKPYDDIWFVTPDVGWAVNSSGHILHTTDGGLSWTEQFHVTADENADVWLRCLGFANPSRGWAGTTSGEHRLYETKDGGNTWISRHQPAPRRTRRRLRALCGQRIGRLRVGNQLPLPEIRATATDDENH